MSDPENIEWESKCGGRRFARGGAADGVLAPVTCDGRWTNNEIS